MMSIYCSAPINSVHATIWETDFELSAKLSRRSCPEKVYKHMMGILVKMGSVDLLSTWWCCSINIKGHGLWPYTQSRKRAASVLFCWIHLLAMGSQLNKAAVCSRATMGDALAACVCGRL